MKIPSLFYGKAGQATSRVRKLAKSLLQTREFGSYDPGPFLDTKEVSGLVLIHEEFEPSSEQHFHCYALSEYIVELSPQNLIRANLREWLDASLESEWRFLCTLGGALMHALRDGNEGLARRYVEAAVNHWPAMALEIERFGPLLEGQTLLQHWHTLGAALGVLGVSARERIAVPALTPQALLDLVDKRGAKQ